MYTSLVSKYKFNLQCTPCCENAIRYTEEIATTILWGIQGFCKGFDKCKVEKPVSKNVPKQIRNTFINKSTHVHKIHYKRWRRKVFSQMIFFFLIHGKMYILDFHLYREGNFY